jgi:hypothetical protein
MEAKYVTPQTASKMFAMSTRLLEDMRKFGGGPPFVKLSRKILYKVADFEKWLEERQGGKDAN